MLDDFDINYVSRKPTKTRYETMPKMKEKYASIHPEIVVRINQIYQNRESSHPSSTNE
jgi:hypothetical protein